MRIAIIAAMGLTLASCTQGPDSSVCTPIIEPTPPSDPVAGVAPWAERMEGSAAR